MCKISHMATNLDLDPDLLARALAISGEKTKKEHLAGQQLHPLIRPVRACFYPPWAEPFSDTTLAGPLHRSREAR